MSRSPRHRFVLPLAVTVLGITLAGCGSSESSGGNGSAAASGTPTTPVAAPTGGVPSGAPGPGGSGGIDFTKVQACLKAAGIALPTTLPSGVPSTLPSGGFNGTPPPGFTPGASGGPGGPSGGPGFLSDPKAQAALKACGITLPTGPPTAAPTS